MPSVSPAAAVAGHGATAARAVRRQAGWAAGAGSGPRAALDVAVEHHRQPAFAADRQPEDHRPRPLPPSGTDLIVSSRFVALIERVAQAQRRDWLTAGALPVLSAALPPSAPSLRAQAAASGTAVDLQKAVAAPTTPTSSWAQVVNGICRVKVLIVSNNSDPDLRALRSAVLAKGGPVYCAVFRWPRCRQCCRPTRWRGALRAATCKGSPRTG